MAFRDLLHGVDCDDDAVSVNLEMFDRASASGGKGVVFSDIIESPGHRAALDVLVRDRLCEVFSVSPGELIDVLAWGMANPEPPLVVDSTEAEVLQCRQEPVDLQKIPIPRHYQEDAGRYQSASVIIAEYDGIRNMSYHRQLLRGKRHCVARFVPRHLRTMYEKARANGDEIPIAVVNGADATVLLAAAMSFNEDLDELTVAAALHSRLHGKPLRMVRLPNGIAVPADSEYAMEARITLELDDEGPYVDITGTVDEVRQEPVIEYDSVYHRSEPVFHALISAGVEHRTLMGMPRAPTIKAAVSKVVNCTDVYLTEGGCGWLSSVVQIKPQHEGDGIKAIHAALDGHRSMKQVVVVDEDIDIANPIRVEWALMTRWQPDTDTVILTGQKGSSLDPSRDEDGSTSKIGMDATLPIGVDRGPFESVL
uniref:Anhydromevalonate phosphate decarboxylase n=1 Tax=uncultured marine group II/III euryarchaeote SAT1000_18_B12 TaxID=1456563 RepID=A0A075IC54_9EURY|nr:3-polyprenyl-4-hydroxybenzoate decarboxylase and related decarboxylases [uncultured marine group II/III euryarchaeote SAT1000_18_B12]